VAGKKDKTSITTSHIKWESFRHRRNLVHWGLHQHIRRTYISYLTGYLKICGPRCDGKERDPDTTHTHIKNQQDSLHNTSTQTKNKNQTKTDELNVSATSTAYQSIFRFQYNSNTKTNYTK
jgi:hypothetical protein